MQKCILWTMKQKQAIDMYARGFSQVEIADALSISQSTVSRYINNPTSKEIEDFYENGAYGVFTLRTGERVLFNRRYKPIKDKRRIVSEIVKTEWFYNDGTWWDERFHNSRNETVVYTN